MKRLAIVLAILIMFMNIPFSANAESIYKDTLKVGISYASVSDGWFSSESDINIIDANSMSYMTTIPKNTKFNVYTYEGFLASDYFSPATGDIILQSVTPISYNNSAYRGYFELRNQNNTLTVINVVNTEEYLASVLGKEMSASWPIEALKAQAVCARNYALTIGSKHSKSGFDICDEVHCQVYAGMSSEAESTRRAVEETKGVTVTYEGEVVSLYYYSCNGGYSESSENVWVNALGYLRGKKDIYENPEYATYYNWSKTYTKAQIEQILANRGINIGQLMDIRIDEVSENNGVVKLTFIGTDGEKTVTKSSTRTTLSLNSQAYTIQKHSEEQKTGEKTDTQTWNLLTSSGLEQVINPKYVITAEGLEEINYEKPEAEETAAYASYTFNGHGWGHLVGMSQWGAYSMAKSGFTYQDILKFYYTDIEIQYNQYDTEDVVDDVVDDAVDDTGI